MEPAAKNESEQGQNAESSEAMASVPQTVENAVPMAEVTCNNSEETATQDAQVTHDEDLPSGSSSARLPSFVESATQMDAGSLRKALLGEQDGEGEPVGDGPAVGDDSATASKKKKKKKKRPKSAQTSSSSGSVLSNPAASGVEDGAEVVLSESLEAMSVSGAAAPATGNKRKKKKKKKDKGDRGHSMPDAENADAEMKDESQNSPGEQRQEQQEGVGPPSNLQRLTQNLLAKKKAMQQQQSSQQLTPMMMMTQSPEAQPEMMRPPGTPGQKPQQQQPSQQLTPMMMMTQSPEAQPEMMRPPGTPGQKPQQQQPVARQQQQGSDQRQGERQQHQQQRQKGKNSQQKNQQKKNVFEPYWPMEDVSAGLKRGTLIEGPIRINPRKYEDAYVPSPDGKADVYISGMTDRNRALNGDVVAVLVQDRDNWRVFTEEVDHYERCNSPLRTGRVTDGENKTAEADREQAAEQEKAEASNKQDDADVTMESPDVLVEEEEEVELDSSGKPIESSLITKQVTGSSATPTQVASTSHTHTPASGKGGEPNKKKACAKGQGSNAKGKRYKSVKEVMDQGSPVVRRLMEGSGGGGGGQEEGEEGSEINSDRFIQPTGKVVAVLTKKHTRACSGSIRPLQDPKHNFAVFAPTDSRVPRIMLPTSELPDGFKERPEDFTKILFIARITEWNETSKMPKGQIFRSLGEAGQLEPETEALLAENNIDSSEFKEEVLACLPQETPWKIPAKELQWRRDLRRECIFTIDPSTARDLDDALHCTDLGGGVYEVGVHIADVSYFVEENTELDEVARKRATSVYLVQKVIPMLPRLLCEQLCSLNPDEDRLSFSVVWKITEEGQILEEWFGRTIIRSCVKLSYDHAQGFIEDPDRERTREELPPISEGFTVDDIKKRVLQMDKIAKALRKARFDGGALRLDQVKIQFTLSKETGLPNGYFVYEQRDSNKLVEEFMLLANMAVAHKIRADYKEKAVLRRHPPPQSRMIKDLKELCSSLGFPVEVESAKDIQLSLARYTGEDELSQARMQILVALCSRPMRNAKYFCCGMLADETLYSHYALNVPLYTHFTSPIRRYPDILVHRTLAAALGYCEVTNRSSAVLQDIAETCNDMKTNAKLCSEKSNELYFAIFVKEAGPLEEKGMVMQVLDKSFDIFVLRLGVVKRVYCERLPLERFNHYKQGKRVELVLVWKADDDCPRMVTQKLAIFSPVNCILKSEPEPLKWSAFISRPAEGDVTIVT